MHTPNFEARSGSHSNVLEMMAIGAALRVRILLLNDSDCRLLHLSESQVCISVACNGRGSASSANV